MKKNRKKPQEIVMLEKKYNIIISPIPEGKRTMSLYSGNYYECIDNEVIVGLCLCKNEIIDLKPLSALTDLTYLNLRENQITDLSALSTLVNLTELNLITQKITDISPLSAINALVKLSLIGNQISNITPLETLVDLEQLSLQSNQISDISPLSNLTNLSTLTLWSNQISDISPLKNLVNLTNLDLDENNIDDLNALSNLPKLYRLFCNFNKLTNISPLQTINSLVSLFINNNNITDISCLSTLSNLSTLHLSANQINDITSIDNLHLIADLNLSWNKIEDYSPLTKLTNLAFLDISYNRIVNFSFVEYLSSLTSLKMNNCKITDISFLKNSEQLTTLELKKNDIAEVSVLSKFNLLKRIDLSSNRIKDINPLKELFKNNIPIVKKSLDFQNGFCIEDNPLQNPSFDIINQGTEAILRFFDKIDKEGIDKIYEVKVTLVGEGSSGKTSLIYRLLDSKASLPTKDKRTRGIEINDWEFKKQSNIRHIAHIWDFGGQDVYYPVHRFFLTENSVFVLLASSRQNTHDFDYWIPTIFQFGGKSPIILGQTCHDGNTKKWNDIGVFLANDNFNIIKDETLNYHELNLPKNNKGLRNVRNSIVNQIIKLPHYKKNVPKSWIPVRSLIESLKKENCISYIDLKIKIQKTNPASFATKDDIEDCVKFFHSIGILLWYHKEDKLKNWVVLNPKWAVDAVYKIIDYKKNTNKGIIISKDFETVWKAKMYDDKHDILKEMLAVFKIAFPKKTNSADYIMPTRLDSIPTDNIWKNDEVCLRLVYNFEFMPKGMVNQISAELSRYVSADDEVWNNAVNLRDSDTVGQVFENFYERKIIVKAKGNDSRALIKLIMNAVVNITDGYKGVKCNITIPCICSKCSKLEIPAMFPYDMLLNKLNDKRENVTCNISDEIFKIETLLFNIGLPVPIVKNENKDIESLKTIKIFLASSNELKEEREQFRIFISTENDRLHTQGIYLKIVQWEYFLDEISNSRLQDEYNKELVKCDIALCLFFTKVGKYSEEEFDTAYQTFKANGTPKIFTYFKNAEIRTGNITPEINSLLNFKQKLHSLGHFATDYVSTHDLHLNFKRQLELHLNKYDSTSK